MALSTRNSSVLEKECARACWGCCGMSRGYVYLELRRTLRYGAPGARIDINIPKNRASCTTRLARSRSPTIIITRRMHNIFGERELVQLTLI